MKFGWAVFVPLLVAYAGALKWMWDSWWLPDSYYSHGPLMPVVAAVVAYLSRDEWSVVPARFDLRAWWLLGPGLAMHFVGAALTVDSLSAMSLCLSIPGALWLVIGWQRFRALRALPWLTLLAVPMPMFVTGKLAFEMKEVAVTAGLWLANLFGTGAARVGAVISIPEQTETMFVADPCSGLRSLVSMVTLGFCIAFFMGEQKGARRWILLICAPPVAVLSNIVRIATICFIARHWDVATATSAGHDILNVLVWAVALAILIGLDVLLSKWLVREVAE